MTSRCARRLLSLSFTESWPQATGKLSVSTTAFVEHKLAIAIVVSSSSSRSSLRRPFLSFPQIGKLKGKTSS